MLENNSAEQATQVEQPSGNPQSPQTPRKKHGKKWRELHPRSLLRAMGAQDGVSEDKIRALVETEYSDPVISLYLGLSPEKVAQEPKGLLRSFHSMKTRALEEHKARNSGDGYIFHGDTGRPLVLANLVRREIRPALKAVGLRWKGWHGFRRGLATTLYQLGSPGKIIQSVLRHAHLNTTMAFYVKPVQAESHKAMAKLEAAFTKSARRSRVA